MADLLIGWEGVCDSSGTPTDSAGMSFGSYLGLPAAGSGGPAKLRPGTFYYDGAWSKVASRSSDTIRTRLLEWVQRKENLVVCGPSGTGKSLLLEALGQAATDAKCTVRWFSIEDLWVLVRRHRVDDSVAKALIPILRADIIVVDDIGLLGISDDAAEGFYRLVDAAYERRSLAVSSNLRPSGFDQLMGKSLATALVDRLLHHAHIIETSGESIRLQDATSGRGVKPLDQ